ncbi:MAG: hypothetical protein EBZ74_02580 [Planctomycetia bacterium]|nr:hypothetical protein [Planctomycetia bacterium]
MHLAGDAFAILLGYAIDDDGAWITAGDLAARWRGEAPRAEVYDGYHVGVVYDGRHECRAGVDPLGLFPLHVTSGSADPAAPLVVATTPEAVAAHPAFAPRVDRTALAGILLVHGPLDDRCLAAGVRRAAAGHHLRWTATRGLEQVRAYRPVGREPPPGESPADARRRIDLILADTLRRHRPAGDDTALLLSGGLDSRLVAGVLADEGIPTRALVFGRSADFEVRAGTAVANALGMPCDVISTEDADAGFPARARQIVRFGHLNSAPGGDDFAAGLALADAAPAYVWSGIVFDWTFEPLNFANGRDPRTGAWVFEMALDYMNRWGVPRRELPSLLGPDGLALCDEVIGRLRAACTAGPAPPVIQSSLVRWDQRVRNHIATPLHDTTFVSWPLLPATDRRLVEAILGLPVATYADRRLEAEILLVRSPRLGSIPLDTNSFVFEPLPRGEGASSTLAKLAGKARRTVCRWYWRRWRGFDPRRYERLFNVDHPRWRAVRRAAEPLRPRLHSMLDPEAVDRILPRPEVATDFRNPVNHGGAIRLLLGLALWTDRPDVRAGR